MKTQITQKNGKFIAAKRWGGRLASVLLLASGVAVSAPLISGDGTSLLGDIARDKPMSKIELAGMRGKDIVEGRVVYFGLSLVSRWQNRLEVNSNISISNDRGKPSFEISSSSTGSQGGSWSENHQGEFQAWNSHGIRQIIQASGENNNIKNIVDMKVGNYRDKNSGSSPPSEGNGLVNNFEGGGGSGGVIVSGDGSINIGINVPGEGVIGQLIGPGGITQYANIHANESAIINSLIMRVGMQSIANPVNEQQLSLLLQSLPGIP